MIRLLKKFACKGKIIHQDAEDNFQENDALCVDVRAQSGGEGKVTHSNCVPYFTDVDVRKRYDLKGLLGYPGSYGEVRVGIDVKSKKAYAVKIMKLQSNSLGSMKAEIEIMKSIRHPHVAAIVSAYENKKMLYIVMEKYDGGDLFDLVVAQGGRLKDERFAARVALQILSGLQYLHSRRIAHCDIKLCNILLTGKSQVKLIDFGASQFVQDNSMLFSEVGSPSFIAPEVLMGAYNELCDMWSVGVVVFILVFGFNPFNPRAVPALAHKEQICENILKGFSPDTKPGYGAYFPDKISVSAEARDFIGCLLVSDWRQRIAADEALRHPWIARQ